jgi:basic membrane lipoprotein Med (substrate-binding protein (PBP1-ABC) superfamily)|tara:strand:- start:94 stop:492 length:399 start_codon:yes stop_codon:yes gene_type:complete
METIYFIVGAVSVSVLFIVGWLVSVVSKQLKQIHNLETVVSSIEANDITESDVRGIVDSRVDKYSLLVDRRFEDLLRLSDDNFREINQTVGREMENIYRDINTLSKDLINRIEFNQVTNTRKVTDGGLQSEY